MRSSGVASVLWGNFSLYSSWAKGSPGVAGFLFAVILIYALGGCILPGIFPVGETKQMLTVSAKIHGYGSALGFLALTLAPLLIALLSLRGKDTAVGAVSFISFALAVLFFALFIMADKERFAGTIISYEGLWQRASLLCMYAPILIISLKRVL